MLLAIIFAVALTQTGDAKTVRALQEFEQQLAAAWQRGDCSAWGQMLAPGWSVIHITGQIFTKEKALEMCQAPRSGRETVTIEDVMVRVFGDAAVVTGRTTAADGRGHASKLVLRFTDVFIREAGQWRVVASQATPVVDGQRAGRQ